MAKRQRKPRTPRKDARGDAAGGEMTELRIVGGRFRGRKLCYHGDPVTRPMKHRVREAIFNLISTEVAGRYAIDLFAGTGALGLEALSRGAVGATFIEKHVPTARIVEQNIAALAVESLCTMRTTSAFLWSQKEMRPAEWGVRNEGALPLPHSAIRNPKSEIPWLVFCSPPYAFYVDRIDEMLALVDRVADEAPAGSIMVVEADERFDFNRLPGGPIGERRTDPWQVRTYPPAVVGIWRK